MADPPNKPLPELSQRRKVDVLEPLKPLEQMALPSGGELLFRARLELLDHRHLSISPEEAHARIEEAHAMQEEARYQFAVPHTERTKQVALLAGAAVIVILSGIVAVVLAPDAERAKYVVWVVGVLGTLFAGVWGTKEILARKKPTPPP